MKLIHALASEYWIENTKRIHDDKLPLGVTIVDSYVAGFKKAQQMAIELEISLNGDISGLEELGEEEV